MSTVATVQLSGWKVGDPAGMLPVGPLQFYNANSTDALSDLTLAPGDNTILVPTATTQGVFIVPPRTNNFHFQLKGAAGDVGIPWSANQPGFWAFPPGTASFILNTGGTVSVRLIWS
jgi:hypothetical protein